MKIHKHFCKIIVISILNLGLLSVVKASPEAVWSRADAYSQGVVNVRTPYGGEWVYKNHVQRTSTPPVALVLGSRTQPDEVQFFSHQEERALWDLAQKMEGAAGAASRSARRRSASDPVWPKVIVTEIEICVPHFQYAAANDWKSHLVCTARGQ
jgi:hypothetical protein